VSALADELNALRLRAFRSNSPEDRAAYFDRLSQAFQRGELVPATASEPGEIEFLEWAMDTLHEINVSNYDHDEACRLNERSVEVILAIKSRLFSLSNGRAA